MSIAASPPARRKQPPDDPRSYPPAANRVKAIPAGRHSPLPLPAPADHTPEGSSLHRRQRLPPLHVEVGHAQFFVNRPNSSVQLLILRPLPFAGRLVTEKNPASEWANGVHRTKPVDLKPARTNRPAIRARIPGWENRQAGSLQNRGLRRLPGTVGGPHRPQKGRHLGRRDEQKMPELVEAAASARRAADGSALSYASR